MHQTLVQAISELEKITKNKAKTVEERKIAIQKAAESIEHANSNIEWIMIAFGIYEKCILQKELTVATKQLYRLLYSGDDIYD